MNKINKWFIVLIGVLFLPPVNYYINRFTPVFGGGTFDIPTWIISVLILIIGIKELIKKDK